MNLWINFQIFKWKISNELDGWMMLFWLNIDESMQWITANKWINDNGNFAVTNDQNCNDDLRFSKGKESKES